MYLRPADGIKEFSQGPASPDRGGINWNGQMYRVFGSTLTLIDSAGVATVLGNFAGATTGQVRFNYSFDRLAIAVSGNLYYWDGATLNQVLDPDLGLVVDMEWVDGYFMTTDGANLVVTELNNPYDVNPLKYGSSEADPDPVVALRKIKNEIYALNRHTIELFDNVGGALFPFARIEGAQIQKGCIGTHACTVLVDVVAFIGGARNEPPLVYIGQNSQAIKISTREIDKILGGYTESQLSLVVMETRTVDDHEFLYINLPDQTLVYDRAASQTLSTPVWFILTSTVVGKGVYKARNFVWVYDKWLCGDPTTSRVGQLTQDTIKHYGENIGWEFDTPIIYNDGKGAIIHEMELVCLTGRNEEVVVDAPTDNLYTCTFDVFGGIGLVSVLDRLTLAPIIDITVPRFATALTIHKTLPRLYVSGLDDVTGDAKISVIDTINNNILTDIVTPFSLITHYLSISPDGAKMYGSTSSGNRVYVFNIVNNTLTATVLIPASVTRGSVVSPDGTMVYVCDQNGFIRVIDAVANTLLPDYACPFGNQYLATNAAGTKLYITTSGASLLVIMNATTGAITNTISFSGASTNSIVMTPDGSKLYIHSVDTATIYVVDVALETIITSVPVGGTLSETANHLAISPDGLFVYFVNNVGGLAVIDTTSNAVVNGASVAPTTFGIQVRQ